MSTIFQFPVRYGDDTAVILKDKNINSLCSKKNNNNNNNNNKRLRKTHLSVAERKHLYFHDLFDLRPRLVQLIHNEVDAKRTERLVVKVNLDGICGHSLQRDGAHCHHEQQHTAGLLVAGYRLGQ